jgi:threonine aldolase
VRVSTVETNIVNIELVPPLTAEPVARAARERGLAISASARARLRAVTHLDVTAEDVERAAELLASAIADVART